MVVAFFMPHNDGVEADLITEAGYNSGTELVDMYEVDGVIRSFANEAEARQWLNAKLAEHGMEAEF